MKSVVDSGHRAASDGSHLVAQRTAIVIHGHVGESETLAPFSTYKTAVGTPVVKKQVEFNLDMVAWPHQ